uniref:Peptidase S1 domain-containing protein n=1 Tax=Panagrolaimus superbus TaxID=310955 RepID=A0A914XX46_9BILA
MFNQITVTSVLLLLIYLIEIVNGELKVSTIFLSEDYEVPQINPGSVQYILKPGDFIGLSKISEKENDKIQKICGKSDSDSRQFKVAMGIRAMPGQFPWVVALGDEQAYCTGTIISSRHIITAAHCVSEYSYKFLPCRDATISLDPSKLKISYGGVCLRYDKDWCLEGRDMKSSKVRKVMLPKHFNDNGCENGGDIAILELDQDLEFNEKTKPICIGHFPSTFEGQLFDLGFGRDEENLSVPNLRFIDSLFSGYNEFIGNVISLPKYFLPKGQKQPGMW